ncbi:unnamed protein product, partial [Oppiella nova]
EEISGPKKDAFRLGVTPGNRSNDIELIRMKLKQEEGKISLFTTKPKIASEYFTEEEMTKFKKPKKVRKVLRKKKAIEATEEVVTDLTVSTDHGSRKSRNRDKEMNIDSNDTKIDKTIVKEEVLIDINPVMLPKSGLRLPAMDVDEDFIDPNDKDLSGIILEEEEADKELEMALHKSRKLKLRSNVEATTGAAKISGPKKDAFRLGVTPGNRSNDIELIRMKLKQEEGKISLFTTKPKIASEYFTEEEMTKFKKPKKVRKVLRKKKAIEATEEVVTDLTVSTDHGSRQSRNRDKEMNIDSNDTKIDKTIIKEEVIIDINPVMLPKSGLRLPAMDVDEDFIDPNDEDLSGIILEEEEADKEHLYRNLLHLLLSNDAESLIPNNIILNSTAEFCRNLGDIPTYGLAGNRDEDEELMELEETLIETRNPTHDSDPNRGQWNEVEVKEDDIAQDLEDNEGQPILEEEPDVSRGLVGALQLAMKKGYLDKEVKKVSASRQSAIESQSYTIEEKFYEDDKIGRRERYSGPVSDFREKNEYRPEIKLDYVDEKGRVLDQKEAFRHLSHKFHGKGPSKNKIDKRMKKKDQQSKLQQMKEEPDVSRGLVGALQLAMKKGYLDKEVKKVSASRQSAIESQSYTIEEKFYEDDKIGRRERYSGPVSDFREKNEYRPEIKLDYVDEKGRVLDQKEAFRHLSHKFHGKGPSKNKIDKRMKKKDQQSKLQQMSSTDTPLNTLKMLTDKQKELQLPYVVLTGAQKTAIQ